MQVGKNLMVVGNIIYGKNQGELESAVSQKWPFPVIFGKVRGRFSPLFDSVPVKTR